MINEIRYDNLIIKEAMEILNTRVKLGGDLIGRYSDVLNFISIHVSNLEHEVFGAILLNPSGRYITHEILFRGTLLHTTVYPREIVKFALSHNASKIILFHNHPGGNLTPSPKDIELTKTMQQVLEVIDIVLIDHIISAGGNTYSFKHDGGYLE